MNEIQLRALLARVDSMLLGVRQYIGARYVPRFVGTYDPTQSYEALDVVDNGSGTSYIAKIPTPAGTPLTDSDHWFLYGSTNGAIINLQQQIDDMKDGTVPGSLQEQINTNTSDITALTNNDIIIIGSSLCTTPNASDNIYNTLIPLLKNHYGNVYHAELGGVGFCDGGYLSLLQSLNVPNPERVKKIVIIGVANDIPYLHDARITAMQAFKTYANATYPNAIIAIAPASTTTIMSEAQKRFEQFKWLEYEQPEFEMEVYAETYHILALSYPLYVGSDGYHPTTSGARLLAIAIYNAIMGNKWDIELNNKQTTVSDKSYIAAIGTPSFMYDDAWINTQTVFGLASLNFTLASVLTIQSYWDNNYFMSANPAIKGIKMDNAKEFQGYLTDKTAHISYPIAATIRSNPDDNDSYWYGINTKNGEAIALTVGHDYSLRIVYNYPFLYN